MYIEKKEQLYHVQNRIEIELMVVLSQNTHAERQMVGNISGFLFLFAHYRVRLSGGWMIYSYVLSDKD